MPQIFVILGPALKAAPPVDGDLDTLGKALISITEETWPRCKEDVSFTAIEALHTINEASLQIEVRFTAGGDEYHTGEIFDPSPEEMEILYRALLPVARDHLPKEAKSISVWIIPHHGTVFHMVTLVRV